MKKIVALLLSVCMLAAVMTSALAQSWEGVWTGVGAGKNGEGSIEVAVTIDADCRIAKVEVTKNGDDAGISDPAVAQLPGAIVEYDSLLVDTVAGATLTSKGILAAVEDALAKAGIAPEDKKATEYIEDEGETEEISTDVLVVGAGIAGLTAAMSAKENGVDVIIIDKMPIPGGTTNLAGGILVCVDSELFADNRIESDSFEAVHAFWENKMAYSGAESGYPDWERLDGVLKETGKTVDWLVSNGIEFSPEPYAASLSYPMALANGGGAGLITMLADRCQAMGAQLLVNTEALSLIQDEETGAVVGAMARSEDKLVTFSAKSVVMATGGISQNEELVAKYSPKLHRAGLIPASSVSHTGEGFLMALAMGAGTFDTFATPLFTTAVDPELSALTDTSAIAVAGQLGVNANGERFGNEAVSSGWDTMDYLPSDMIQDGNAPFWYVFDSTAPEAALAALQEGAEYDVVACGETIEELARDMHVYTGKFAASVEAYNAAAAAGVDEQFGKDAAFLTAIEKAPFYAVKVYPTTFGSAGGVTTTDQGRVTRPDGSVIPGLYAAGEMSNRYFYNENYILAGSLAMYSTMGHRAGAAAAADALAK